MAASIYKFTTANTNNLQLVPGGLRKLMGASLIATTDAVYYVKFWWREAGAIPTVGTDAPDLVIAVPALGATGSPGSTCVSWPGGILQGNGPLYVACVTGAADSDNTAVAAGQGVVNLVLE